MASVNSIKNRFEQKAATTHAPTVLGSSKWAPAPRSTPAHFEQKQKDLKKQGSALAIGGNKSSSSSNGAFFKSNKPSFSSSKSSLLDANVSVKSTPAAYEGRLREMTAKEREAKKIARQQAARVNLTIRALELGKLRNQDVKAKPNMVSNLYVATESPMMSKADPRDNTWNKARAFAPLPAVHEAPSYTHNASSNDDNGWETKDEEPSWEPPHIELPEVEHALETGDDDALNNAVVSNFLESTGRSATESTRMLQEFKGREEELMTTLLEEEQHKLDEETEANSRVDHRTSTRGYVTAARPRTESGNSAHSGWDE